MPSLLRGFVDSVHQYPNRVALHLNEQRVSYHQLALRASKIAALIESSNPGDGPWVGLMAAESMTAYAGVVAILGAQRGFVPIDPSHPPQRIKDLVDHSEVATLVVGVEALDRLDPLLDTVGRPLTIIAPEAEDLRGVSARYPRHRFRCKGDLPKVATLIEARGEPAAPAYLLYTSGRSDEPRGVAVSHGNASAYLEAITTQISLRPQDRCSHSFPLSFDLSIHDLFTTWSAGAALVVWTSAQRTDPGRFIEHHRLSSWFCVPTVAMTMERLGELRPNRFPSLRQTLFCGEPLARSVARAWQQAAPNASIINLYGPTEATVAIAGHRFRRATGAGEDLRDVVCLGRIFDGHQALVVDAHGEPVAMGERGELWVCGPQVTRGYWRAAEATKERFVQRGEDERRTWFRTGDLVEADPCGGLHFQGRLDEQIKVRGHHVELGEVDRVLRRACGHEMAAAVGWPRSATGVYGLVGLIATDEPLDSTRVLARCRRYLPNPIVPDRLVGIRRLPTNKRGKLDRIAMQQLLQHRGI